MPDSSLDPPPSPTLSDPDTPGGLTLSSVEINLLIYTYLLESNFQHSAFSILHESGLAQTSLWRHFNPSTPPPPPSRAKPNGAATTPGIGAGAGAGLGKSPASATFGTTRGKIPRGELVRWLWKGLRLEHMSRHLANEGRGPCPNPFHLVIPHFCPKDYPSAKVNPSRPNSPMMKINHLPPQQSRPFPLAQPDDDASSSTPGPAAGASRPARSAAVQTAPEAGPSVDKGKRKAPARGVPDASREGSRARSASPSKASRNGDSDKPGRKKARTSAGTAMDVDDDPPKRERGRQNPSRKPESSASSTTEKKGKRDMLSVPSTSRRSPSVSTAKPGSTASKSPAPPDSDAGDSEELVNPCWISKEDIAVFAGHKDMVSSVAWNPSISDLLATGSSDGTARIWHVAQGEEGKLVQGDKETLVVTHKSVESSRKAVTAVAWHPSGSLWATGCDDSVVRIYTPDGQITAILNYGRGKVNALKFSPSGRYILAAKDDYTVACFNTAGGLHASYEAHSKEVNDIDWLDDHIFASGANDHTAHVFRVDNKRSKYSFKAHTDDVTRVAWSPEGLFPNDERFLATASDDGLVIIWRMASYPDKGTSHSEMSDTRSASPQKKAPLDEDDYFGNQKEGRDGLVKRLVVVEESDNKRMNTLAWSPGRVGGRALIAAGGQDSSVKVFDALTGETLHVLPDMESGTGSLAFSPIALSGYLAAGGWDGELIIWDLESGEKVKEWEVLEVAGESRRRTRPLVMTMAWRDDGKHLAIGTHSKRLIAIHMGDLEPKAITAATHTEGEGEEDEEVEEVEEVEEPEEHKDGGDAVMQEV